MKGAFAFAAGLLFGVGLLLSGMTVPANVLGFLDVAGSWKPTLAFVMIGAIAVHAPFALRRRSATPRASVDARLVAGAALFGVGWGLSGYCPGPALVSLAALSPSTVAFVGAMAIGMFGARFAERVRANATTASDAVSAK